MHIQYTPEVESDLAEQLAEYLGGGARLSQQRELVQEDWVRRDVDAGHRGEG